ncbi:MAG: ribonuclease P protein component [Candidatus Omnitrophica bacterium]|nr:ribonuclease P protein component [Candidatus Omnitrophota bacterium]
MKMDRGLSGKDRILKNVDYRRVLKGGRTYREGVFVVGVYKSALKRHRLGISISAKRVRLATRRNRLRRLIKESFRINKIYYKKGYYDIVVALAKTPDAKLSFQAVNGIMGSLLKKAGVME